VDGVGAGPLGGRHDRLGAQVGLRRRDPAERHRLAGLGDERRVAVRVGEHRHGGDPQPVAGAQHPARDLAAVGDQQLADRRGHIRNTP
jgi:hypothetical protein